MLEQISKLWQSALDIWLAGGWAMIALLIIALLMFGLGVHVMLRLRGTGYHSVPEETWRGWIQFPDESEGPIGELVTYASEREDCEDMSRFFHEVQKAECEPFDRDLKVMKTCVSAAPLVGLLGTVTGMLTTFGALSSGPGGDQTMGQIAAGISEALVTTQTGLVIALPGLFFHHHLHRSAETYKAFLAHLETVCTQAIYDKLKRRKRDAVRDAANAEVAERLRGRLLQRQTG